MFKKLNVFLNSCIGSSIGVFVGYGAYAFIHYKTHPDYYAMQSAPWYTGMLVYGLLALLVLAAAALVKLVIYAKRKKP